MTDPQRVTSEAAVCPPQLELDAIRERLAYARAVSEEEPRITATKAGLLYPTKATRPTAKDTHPLQEKIRWEATA